MDSYVGKRNGRLTIIEDLGYFKKEGTSKKRHWIKCQCDCGNITTIRLDHFKPHMTTSCGCKKAEICKQNGINSKKYNDYYIDDNNVVHVKMFNSDKEMLCDLEDWEKLKELCWGVDGNDYARARNISTGGNILFHQMVCIPTEKEKPDHINRNTLDNRKRNLRLADKSKNAMNSKLRSDNISGHKGVKRLSSGKYYARITVNKKEIHLGTFGTYEEAVKAREEAEIKYFGEFRSVI